jgi:hypothetical protein
MKISRLTRFPYPVLEGVTGDYVTGEFAVSIEISESLKTGALRVHYDLRLTEESLSKHLEAKRVNACLFISCLETYYSGLHEISGTSGLLEIEHGLLSGTVKLLPLIIALERGVNISGDNLHEDFHKLEFQLGNGEILAIGSEFQINVGREKLAPIESIFNMAINNDVPPGQFRVNLDEEQITILAEPETYTSIYSIRNTTPGKSVLLNSIYLPAVMEVLTVLQEGAEPYQDKRWYKVFEAKCTHENVNFENPDLLRDSQKLLRSPFKRIVTLMQEMG